MDAGGVTVGGMGRWFWTTFGLLAVAFAGIAKWLAGEFLTDLVIGWLSEEFRAWLQKQDAELIAENIAAIGAPLAVGVFISALAVSAGYFIGRQKFRARNAELIVEAPEEMYAVTLSSSQIDPEANIGPWMRKGSEGYSTKGDWFFAFRVKNGGDVVAKNITLEWDVDIKNVISEAVHSDLFDGIECKVNDKKIEFSGTEKDGSSHVVFYAPENSGASKVDFVRPLGADRTSHVEIVSPPAEVVQCLALWALATAKTDWARMAPQMPSSSDAIGAMEALRSIESPAINVAASWEEPQKRSRKKSFQFSAFVSSGNAPFTRHEESGVRYIGANAYISWKQYTKVVQSIRKTVQSVEVEDGDR